MIEALPDVRAESVPMVSNIELEKLRSREAEFLKSLFLEINPRLIRLLATHKIFGPQAEDLIHQSWETFFARLDDFEGRSQIGTFLIGILINKIREQGRLDKRIILEGDSEDVLAKSFTSQGWWITNPVNPEKMLENKKLGLMIDDCMEGLSEAQKAAFVLIEVEDVTAQAVSEQLGVSVSHLRVLLFRAKEKLRRCLEGKDLAIGQ